MGAPLTLTMPVPPSLNNIFTNVRGKGRVRTARYRTWARAAGNEVMAQTKRNFPGPVLVDITCKRPRSNCDVDNYIKGCLDLLVDMAVLSDDKNVQEVRARWGDCEGAVVTIIPLAVEAAE